MNTKDFRLGNYINIDIPISEEGKLIKIGVINQRLINGVEIKKYKPIRLTEEWLIKFGFEAYPLDWFYFYGMSICINYKNGMCKLVIQNNPLVLRIRYVHEFQNIYYYLLGKDLKIKP